jgi:hypothetical protein
VLAGDLEVTSASFASTERRTFAEVDDLAGEVQVEEAQKSELCDSP